MSRYIILFITLLALMMGFIPTCNAGIAFMANNPNQLNLKVWTTTGQEIEIPLFGHVGFGYQKADGTFMFGSFGPKGGLDWSINDPLSPVFAQGFLDIKNLKDMQAVKQYLLGNGYRNYKIFQVDNPNPQNAWDTMVALKDSNYYLLTSVPVEIEGTNSENCLTFAKKVLEAYGLTDLPAIVYPVNCIRRLNFDHPY
jgi:hypothetical protein